MENEKQIEELQDTLSVLLNGLSSSSLNLDNYYMFEDIIFNKHFDLAVDLLTDNKVVMSESDRLALLFIFNNALVSYNSLIK